MIQYSNEGFGPFASSLLFQCKGTVIHKAFICALVPAILAALLCHLNYSDASDDFRKEVGGDTLKASQLWVAMGGTLLFLISFRTNKAYGRFWDGTTLLHQMWGEWFDAASCLVAFTTLSMRTKKDSALEFRHTLVRLVSLLHASALEEISAKEDSDYGYRCLDIGNLDQSTLQYLKDCKFNKNLNFNRVEVILHMIQILVVHSQDSGVIKIPPPILSRVFQTLSRGQVNLANCKKITATLFPFPYAQLIAVLVASYLFMTPVVMAGICEKAHWAFIFTFIPVFGLCALNYVARELELPFGNDANDLPLTEFQEHMNNSMLMLIREESDHVCHTSDTCDKEWDTVKAGISEMRPKHFIDPVRENSGTRVSLPLSVPPPAPMAATPAAAPAAPSTTPPPLPMAALPNEALAAPSTTPPAQAAVLPPGAPAAPSKETAEPSEPKLQTISEGNPKAFPAMEPRHIALERMVQTMTSNTQSLNKTLMTCAEILGAQLAENDDKNCKKSTRSSEVIPGGLAEILGTQLGENDIKNGNKLTFEPEAIPEGSADILGNDPKRGNPWGLWLC